jgi:hypothetical protein
VQNQDLQARMTMIGNNQVPPRDGNNLLINLMGQMGANGQPQ